MRLFRCTGLRYGLGRSCWGEGALELAGLEAVAEGGGPGAGGKQGCMRPCCDMTRGAVAAS